MPKELEVEVVNSIELVTAPVIEYSSVVAEGSKVSAYIESLNLNAIEPTEDNKKLLKEKRSELTKQLDDYEASRKFIKNGVMNPYNDFEKVYNDNIKSKLQDAISQLKSGIDSIESSQLESKTNLLKEYFKELNTHKFVSFESLGLKVNISTSENKLKEEIDVFIEKVSNDVKLINSMDNSELIMARYEKTLDVNQAILSVKEELRRAEELKNAKELADKVVKAEVKANVQDPKEAEQVYVMKFSVKGTKTQLGSLKQFMLENGIEFKGE